jgi:type I restriction enzyme M protein
MGAIRLARTRTGGTEKARNRSALPFATGENGLDTSALCTWLWDAACAIRGAQDAAKFKDFILPLVFYKRLSDVFDDEVQKHVETYGDEATARMVIEKDHEDALKEGRRGLVRFYIPQEYAWSHIRHHPADGDLGEFITTAMREVGRQNSILHGVVDVKDFNERQAGQRTLDDDRLAQLIEVLDRHRLGLGDAEPDILGRAYEYLLRKFAEGAGQSAGEFYTPKEVGWLMARLLDPGPYSEVYDPCCGSGGLLIKCRLHYEHTHPGEESKAPKLSGQELTATTFALAKMNAIIHDYPVDRIAIGDTFTNPVHSSEAAGLTRFDYVIANPMWNQNNYGEAFYESDRWSRFTRGIPPKSSADWGWLQHMLSSLKEGGRAGVVLDTGAVSRGSGSRSSNRERDIRKAFVEEDLVEGVVLLPENLFFNTTAPGIIMLLRKSKPEERRGQFLLINLSQHFEKDKPKNVLTDEGIEAAVEAYGAWETRDKLCRVVTLDEVWKADYNLSPSQFVEVTDREEHRPLGEILSDFQDARIEREQADEELARVLQALGLDGESL